MTDARQNPLRPQRLFALLASLSLLASAFAGCGEPPEAAANLRGRGPMVSRYADITLCTTARYEGPETPLYSNRPYHTQSRVDSLRGLTFCRGERHGTNIWIIDVSQTTRLSALGNAGFGLEDRGWTATEARVRVEAAGTPFDRSYTRRIEPGRYVIRQGFSRAAPLVFWDDAVVEVAH